VLPLVVNEATKGHVQRQASQPVALPPS
jgi:hypothetical protein